MLVSDNKIESAQNLQDHGCLSRNITISSVTLRLLYLEAVRKEFRFVFQDSHPLLREIASLLTSFSSGSQSTSF